MFDFWIKRSESDTVMENIVRKPAYQNNVLEDMLSYVRSLRGRLKFVQLRVGSRISNHTIKNRNWKIILVFIVSKPRQSQYKTD